MTIHQSLRVDRDDLCGNKPQAGPKASTATPPERREISQWACGGMAQYIRDRWKNWRVEDDTAGTAETTQNTKGTAAEVRLLAPGEAGAS